MRVVGRGPAGIGGIVRIDSVSDARSIAGCIRRFEISEAGDGHLEIVEAKIAHGRGEAAVVAAIEGSTGHEVSPTTVHRAVLAAAVEPALAARRRDRAAPRIATRARNAAGAAGAAGASGASRTA